ncbi:potassium channel family protein [Usitatibacter palustris]|uniref:Potassium channel domain-containing protein n=1 Tax=Usitatibacter palustris TaxID=2732487 RepID=A0A6M4H645_9PROT|nr:potassium channel family protein [Usitatibacter palustris]QJR14792.1 hypothetical protein DSM104440_01602 [Usitatibacter palustris]
MEAQPAEVPREIPRRRFPLADRALTMMVVVIFIDIFLLSPIAESLGGNRHWADLILAVVLLLGALAIWGNLWIADFFVATTIGSIGLSLGTVLKLWPEQPDVAAVLSCVNFFILGGLIARQVFAPGEVNAHRVQGAVAVYLIAGLLFAQIFRLISISFPGAFLLLGKPAIHSEITHFLTYYSFVSLTTLGFGDITPVHPLARSFTLLAAVFGTLYPAILIGKLVSEQIMDANKP